MSEQASRRPRTSRAIPPEARDFQGERAGIVSRVLANTLDFAFIVIVLAAMYLGWAALRFLIDPQAFTFPAPKLTRVLLVACGLLVFYFWWSWAGTGRTWGDSIMGLRVVSYSGRLMRFSGALLRAVFCVGFPIGLFWAVFSRENRSVQDFVLRTSVIYDWEVRPSLLGHEPKKGGGSGRDGPDSTVIRPG